MLSKFVRAAALYLAFTLVLGVGYTFGMTALGQALFPGQAKGSLITEDGRVVGSELLAQSFTGEGFFHPRASLAGNGYDAASSGASNLGPTSAKLVAAVEERTAAAQALNGQGGVVPMDRVPVDMVTASGSGLDPHISPESARYQAGRVARARGLPEQDVLRLVEAHVEGRTLGVIGEPRVNVLMLNRALRDLPGSLGGAR